MILAPAYDQKCPLRPLVLTTDVSLVQTLHLIILDFYTGNSFFSSDRRMYLDAIIWPQKSDVVNLAHTKNC